MAVAYERPEKTLEKGAKLLEYYEKGPWPSHVTEIKKTGYPLEAYAKGLALNMTQWYGGSAKIRFVFVGFITRRTKDGKYTEIHFRVLQNSGQFYKADWFRKLLEFTDKYGLGLIEATGQTGALVLSLKNEVADEAVDALRALGTDLAGTGDTFREMASCVGPALCEYALYDTLAARDFYYSDNRVKEEMANQLYPFKIKLKFSGCPMDCAKAGHRADFGFIGFWNGAPEVDKIRLNEKIKSREVDPRELKENCPSKAISWDSKKDELVIDGKKCVNSMNCIRRAYPAIKPGKDRKIGLFTGGNVKGRWGPKMGKPVAALDDYRSAGNFMWKLIDDWSDTTHHKDRLGDYIAKKGFKRVMEEFKDSVPPGKRGEPAGMPRIVDSAVLTDEERKTFSNWADAVVKEYYGGKRRAN